MSRTLNSQLLRRLYSYFRPKNVNISLPVKNFKTFLSKGGKTLVGSQICNAALTETTYDKINVEDDLRKACEEGDAAIIRLLDQLREFVIIVSREYRCCIIKQIEITEIASSIGPLAEAWDELPKYRTLAAELNKELNDYIMLFRTIGHMAHEESLHHFVKNSNDNLHSVSVKYKELETVLEREFEENKKFDVELLRIKRDSILRGVAT